MAADSESGQGVFCVEGLLQPVLLRVLLVVMKHIRFEDFVSLQMQNRSTCCSVGGEKASWMGAVEKLCSGGSEVEFGFVAGKRGLYCLMPSLKRGISVLSVPLSPPPITGVCACLTPRALARPWWCQVVAVQGWTALSLPSGAPYGM